MTSTPQFDPDSEVLPLDLLQRGLDAVQALHSAQGTSLADLKATVDRLTRELTTAKAELAASARWVAIGQSTAQVVRSIREEMAPLGLYARWLKQKAADEGEHPDLIARMETDLSRWDAMLGNLATYAAVEPGRRERLILRELVTQTLSQFRPQLEARSIQITLDLHLAHTIHGNRELLSQALANLLQNACEAMPRGGEIVITSYICHGAIELEVADSGPGLFDETKRRAFEPFYSRKKEGLGLGLALVKEIVTQHGGHVSITNCPEGGAAFTLRFPQIAQATRAAA